MGFLIETYTFNQDIALTTQRISNFASFKKRVKCNKR
jgi:hypothetical protein